MVHSPRGQLAGLLAVTVACGLRSDPLSLTREVEDSEDGAPEPSSCAEPYDLPLEPGMVHGRIDADIGALYGWCGRDGGSEDVYRLRATSSTDISIWFIDAETEFSPTLRVERESCGSLDEGVAVCADDVGTQRETARHFFAEEGLEYTLIVDAPTGASGAYAFALDLGAPDQACAYHPQTIQQIAGNTFTWSNALSAGQGGTDGACGGPGREDVFVLDARFSGSISVVARGYDGFEPVVSLRRGCGGSTELACSGPSTSPSSALATLNVSIPAAGTYYVVVDQAGHGGGRYELQVSFE